jgi:hypothetical protein
MQNKVASCLYLFLEHCTLLAAVERTGRCSPLGWPWLTWRCCLQQQPLCVLLILWGMEQWTKLVIIMLKLWQQLDQCPSRDRLQDIKVNVNYIWFRSCPCNEEFLRHICTFCKTHIILLNLAVEISPTWNEMPIFMLPNYKVFHTCFFQEKITKFYLSSINKSGVSIYNWFSQKSFFYQENITKN